MGLFEFFMVLVSVVIGLGVSEVLTGWAKLLRARHEVEPYWVLTLVQAGVFFAFLQQWWEFWDLAGVGQITFGAVLVLLAPSVFLFLVAHLLFPGAPGEADLKAYYYRQAPLLWGLILPATAAGTFLKPLVFGYPVINPTNLSGIPVMGLCLALALSANRRLHAAGVVVVTLLVVLDTVLANPAISIG